MTPRQRYRAVVSLNVLTIVRMWYEILPDLTKPERKSDCPCELSDAVQFSLSLSPLSPLSPPLSRSFSLVPSILPLSFIRTYKYVRTSSTHVELNFALTKVRDKGKERTDERTGYRCSESLNRMCVVLSTVDSRTLTSACTHAFARECAYMLSSACFSRICCYVYLWQMLVNFLAGFDDLSFRRIEEDTMIKLISIHIYQVFNKAVLIWKIVCWEISAKNIKVFLIVKIETCREKERERA